MLRESNPMTLAEFNRLVLPELRQSSLPDQHKHNWVPYQSIIAEMTEPQLMAIIPAGTKADFAWVYAVHYIQLELMWRTL